MQSTYTCSFVALRSCLINLPQPLARSLGAKDVAPQDVVAILKFRDRQAFAGWTGHAARDTNSLEIDPAFARDVGVLEGGQVTIEVRVRPQQADVVWVEPQSADDWEVMELHASFLELNLLSQIRAVSTLHPLTVYLSANTSASITVKKIEPGLATGEVFAKVSPTAEIIVSPKTRQTEQTRTKSGKTKTARSTTSTKKSQKPTETRRRPEACLRCLLAPDGSPASRATGLEVFVSGAAMRSRLGVSKYVTAEIVLPPSLRPRSGDSAAVPAPFPMTSTDAGAAAGSETVIAQRIVLQVRADDHLSDDAVWLSDRARRALRAAVGSRVKLQPAEAPKKGVDKLRVSRIIFESPTQKELRLNARPDQALLKQIREELADIGMTPLTHGLRLDTAIVQLGRPGEWVTLDSLDGVNINLDNDIVDTREEASNVMRKASPVRGVDKALQTIDKALRRACSSLIFGPRGSGKSSVAEVCVAVAERHGAHIVRADCGKLAHERIQVIKDAISDWFSRAAWYAPSIVVLDDLDRLCAAELEHADSTRARQIAEIFAASAKAARARHPISLLATAQAKESLHDLLTTGHLFEESVALRSPDKLARRDIIEAIVEEADNVDALAVANMTEGYLPGDLELLTERAKHERLIRLMQIATATSGEPHAGLTTADYSAAIQAFTPASLRGIKLQKSTVAWSDIGGLTETRKILLETLEWPTRYAPIFQKCPLRLRSGLLLYGYPGCGKTLLASAVASECGLNFISVKGPELLNKYIGASEKSVRDLFDRAQAAKPCVLFFDEFDSIAPKRGHDSTGVTDRVVNQMLTQMDGAEGLDGVYVLAATSRPDLIDPALLRPGRLDKSLLCDMPTHEDRVGILQALSGKMHLAAEVDLAVLASRTAGFSGADMQALLYNAHLGAIHDALARSELSEKSQTDSRPRDAGMQFTRIHLDKLSGVNGSASAAATTSAERAAVDAKIRSIVETTAADSDTKTSTTTSNGHGSASADGAGVEIAITWRNLDASLSTTRPSISQQERARLDAVYRAFVDGRSADGLPNGMPPHGEQRATLG